MMKLGKKLMVLMLAGLMSFGAAACGGGGDTTSTGGGNKPGGGTSEAPIEGVDNPYTMKPLPPRFLAYVPQISLKSLLQQSIRAQDQKIPQTAQES